MMIIPVRTGYIGHQNTVDPADLPNNAVEFAWCQGLRTGCPRIEMYTLYRQNDQGAVEN